MEYNIYANRLVDFMKQVAGYYSLCNYQMNGPIVFSRQMASLALPNLPQAELAGILRYMETQGMINILSYDQLSFVPASAS